MKKNVGKPDRGIRVILGLIIIGLGFGYQSWWGLIGLLPLVTGLAGRCLPYAMFGFSTCAVKEQTQN